MRHPIGQPPPARSRRLGIRLLAVLLALAGTGLIGITLSWPLLDRSETMRPADDPQTLAVGVREFGFDRQDRPYSIRARTAFKVEDAPKQIFLTEPDGEITGENGAWYAVTAAHGRWDEDRELLYLSGEVHFHHDSGLEFVTEAATVDPESGSAWGVRFVTGQGPSGELRASGFRVLPGGGTVVFPGPARLLLAPSAVQADGSGNLLSATDRPGS